MQRTHRPIPRKRSALTEGSMVAPPVVDVGQETILPQDQALPRDEQLRQQAIDNFETSLRGQSDLDEEGLDFLLQAFRQAVQETPLDAQFTPADPEEIARTLNELVDSGALGEDDRNELARKFEQAFSPFEDRDVKIALELAQRIERDGESKAMEWLEAQQRSREGNHVTEAMATDYPGLVPKQSVTRSRSRRLRGPPARP